MDLAAQEILSAIHGTKPPINVNAAASLCGARVVRHRFSSDALSGFVLRLDGDAVIGSTPITTNAGNASRSRMNSVTSFSTTTPITTST